MGKFGDDTPLSVMLTKLVNLCQHPHENIKTYIDRTQDLFDRLKLLSENHLAGAPEDSRSTNSVFYIYHRLLLDYWQRGIRDQDLRQTVLSNNFIEFSEATKYAKYVEVVYRDISSVKANSLANVGKNSFNYFKKTDYNPEEGTSRIFKKEIKTELPSKQHFSKPGFFKPGGSKPNFSGHGNSKPGVSRYGNQRAHLQCSFCGKTGHIEQYCRKKEAMHVNMMHSKNEIRTQDIPPDILIAELMRQLGTR